MIDGVTSLLLLNFFYIGILPRIFFRKDGRYNLQWWVTAGPLFISPILVLLARLGLALPLAVGMEVPAALLSALSIGMISLTIGTHRIPLALWHQDNDAPRQIVTWGAYSRIRHPFYASFLLSQVAAVLYVPHYVTLGALLYAVLILSFTASKEERKLSGGAMGAEYRAYLKRSGRFFPYLGSIPADPVAAPVTGASG